MTTDRETLEFAAKACGVEAQWDCYERGMMVLSSNGCDTDSWNPLTSSADCAAMCAKLEIDTIWFATMVECEIVNHAAFAAIYSQFSDREAAWRCAATQVAAMLGGMK